MIKKLIILTITLVLTLSIVPLKPIKANAEPLIRIILYSGEHAVFADGSKVKTIDMTAYTPLGFTPDIKPDRGYVLDYWLGIGEPDNYEGAKIINNTMRGFIFVISAPFVAICKPVNLSTYFRLPILPPLPDTAITIDTGFASVDEAELVFALNESLHGISIQSDEARTFDIPTTTFEGKGEQDKSLVVGNLVANVFFNQKTMTEIGTNGLTVGLTSLISVPPHTQYEFDSGQGIVTGLSVGLNVHNGNSENLDTTDTLAISISTVKLGLTTIQKYDLTVLGEQDGEFFEVTCSYDEDTDSLAFLTRNTIGKFRVYYTPYFPVVSRISGSSRYKTAVEVSKAGWQTVEDLKNRDYVCITSGEKFPDALAGGPMAYELSAPLLLTKAGSLTDATRTEIIRLRGLGVRKAVIFGGHSVVAAGARAELTALGFKYLAQRGSTTNQQVDFHGGDPVEGYKNNRYGTAASIAWTLTENTSLFIDTVIITTGAKFPDALAIVPIAAGDVLYEKEHRSMMPILYSHPQGGLPDDTITAIELGDDIDKAVILGGYNAVPANVEDQLAALGVSATRIAGSNRYKTAMEIVRAYEPSGGFDRLIIATGAEYADALAGGVYAAKEQIPILLVNKTEIDEDVLKYIRAMSPKEIIIIGGESAVSITVQDLLSK